MSKKKRKKKSVRKSKSKVSKASTEDAEVTEPEVIEPEVVEAEVVDDDDEDVTSGSAAKLPAKGPTSTAPVDPLLAAYMREVQKYPLLDREEEHELAVRWFENQDRNAFQKLVTSNLRFVVKVAYEYLHYRAKLLDLIQEGNTGLIKAVHDFDPYRGVRLTTYAVWWIRSYIQDSILKNYSLVKMGTTRAQKKLFYRLRAEQRELEKQGIRPGNEQVKLLAAKLDVREKDVKEMQQRMSGRDFSLNSPLTSEENQTHIDLLSDETPTSAEQLGNIEHLSRFKEILENFGDTLEGRDKVFFEKRLISENPETLQALGDEFGVSKERARQVEAQIKERLRKYVEENFPDYELLNN